MRFQKRTIALLLTFCMVLTIFIGRETVFAKQVNVSRETALTMLIKEFANKNFKNAKSMQYKTFKDWAKIKKANRIFIGKALNNSIITKTKYFYPTKTLSRSSFAKWVVKVLKKADLKLLIVNNVEKTPYRDISNSDILYLYKRGIMRGVNSIMFSGKSMLTLSQMNAVKSDIEKAIKLKNQGVFVPSEYENMIQNGEFENVLSKQDYDYPVTFTTTSDEKFSVKSDVGTYGKGMALTNGVTTTSTVKIPETYAGYEFLVTYDAKFTDLPYYADTGLKIDAYAKGTGSEVVKSNTFVSLNKNDIDISEKWNSFGGKLVLPSKSEISGLTTPYFNVRLECTGGRVVIDNLQFIPVKTYDDSFYSFAFTKASNPSLAANIPCTINQETGEITARVPEGLNVSNLKASFKTTGGTVTVGGVGQISDNNSHNFSNKIIYTVTSFKGNKRQYQVNLRVLNTGIPSVVINTDTSQGIISQDIYANGTIRITGGTTDYSIPLNETKMQIKGRGNTSWGMDKKPYKIKFLETTSVLGLPANKDWILIANYGDKSLMRNYLAYKLAASLNGMAFAPRMNFVNVFINGRYNGLYLIGDQIEIAKNRVNVTTTAGTDTGFILEANVRMNMSWYNPSPSTPFIFTKSPTFITKPNDNFKLQYMEFTDPEPSKLTSAQMNSIAAFINSVDIATSSKNSANYDSLIDYRSFNDWFIVEELFSNLDSGFFSSCFMHKDVGGKLQMGPVWDFDASAGNHTDSHFTKTEGWVGAGHEWLSNVCLNGQGSTRLKARWNEIKQDKIDTMFSLIDDTAELIKPSVEENFQIWQIQGKYVWPNSPLIVQADTFDKQITYLKQWMTKRINWMDSQL